MGLKLVKDQSLNHWTTAAPNTTEFGINRSGTHRLQSTLTHLHSHISKGTSCIKTGENDATDLWLVLQQDTYIQKNTTYCYTFVLPQSVTMMYQVNITLATNTMKKCSETQTLCTDCSKVEPKIFAPPQTPFPGVRDEQNLISWRWRPLPINPVWWGSMHAISSYHGNRPTHTHTQPQTDRTDYNTLRCS